MQHLVKGGFDATTLLAAIANLNQQLVAAQQDIEYQRSEFQDTLTKVEGEFQEKLTKVEGELIVEKAEKNRLQKKLDDAMLKLDHANANSDVSLPMNKELKELIKAKTKSILWSRVKFIQGPEEEMIAAKMLLGYADKLPKEHLKSKASRKALATTYKLVIRRAIFQQRNYVTAEHKKVMVKRFENKGSMPTVEQLVQCLQRNIKTEDDLEIFEFYWEKLLPKQVGSLMWSKDVRNYNTICGAMRRDVRSHPMITPEDEAFTVLVIENSYDRWVKELQEKEAGGQKDAGGQGSDKRKKPNYNGKYTATDSGQNEWGGWSDEGLDVFKKYVDMNRAARKENDTIVLERTCLGRLKAKYNIVCNDPKAQCDLDKSNKRKRRRGEDELEEHQKKKPTITIHEDYHPPSSDDEDGEDDDEGSYQAPPALPSGMAV